MYTIGELARRAGITVRTLHHYDGIGLLKPSSATEGGHRLYSDEDIIKLEQISILKRMGLSLKAIREMLTHYGPDWQTCLKDQLEMVKQEKEKLHELESMLHATLHSVQIEGTLNWSTMFEMIRLSQRDPAEKIRYMQAHFSTEERESLKNLPNLNKEETGMQPWLDIIAEAKTLMHEDPASDAAQHLAGRITEMAVQAMDGNMQLVNKVWDQHGKSENPMRLYPLDPELLAFLDAAFLHYDQTNGEKVNVTIE
ncbi:MerR family transcriptional regulator [Paenibacillus sp. FJAT-26967]|uniref:MerR family transcriptional regulator n=1 Tax=Paenibacillus sp. FJAT-26967 TaxID=1729690 RepID=UPI0008393508|nr:MerR family transcriptional regulator [Paenibacillus sp. FJAT-26967]